MSCALGCPYEGHMEPSKVAEVRTSLYILLITFIGSCEVEMMTP